VGYEVDFSRGKSILLKDKLLNLLLSQNPTWSQLKQKR